MHTPKNSKPDLSPEDISTISTQLRLRCADLWEKQLTHPREDIAKAIAQTEQVLKKLES